MSERRTTIKPATFSGSAEAELERNRCDYSVRFDQKTARSGRAPCKVRVYADGIFDLFHPGHANFLKQVKSLFPNTHLIVSVCSDELTHHMKDMTVTKDTERYELVSQCRYADGIFDLFHPGHANFLKQVKSLFPNNHLIVGVCSDELTHNMKDIAVTKDTERYEIVSQCRYVDEVLPNAPWKLESHFTDFYKIDFVAHDDVSYPSDGGDADLYCSLKRKKMFVATERSSEGSTTDLITRVVKRYDHYIARNLKRGVTPEHMGLSPKQAKKFLVKNARVCGDVSNWFEGFGLISGLIQIFSGLSVIKAKRVATDVESGQAFEASCSFREQATFYSAVVKFDRGLRGLWQTARGTFLRLVHTEDHHRN